MTNVTQAKDLLYNLVQGIVSPYLDDPRGIRLLGVGFSNLIKEDESQKDLTNWFSTDHANNLNTKLKIKLKNREKEKEGLGDWFDQDQ